MFKLTFKLIVVKLVKFTFLSLKVAGLGGYVIVLSRYLVQAARARFRGGWRRHGGNNLEAVSVTILYVHQEKRRRIDILSSVKWDKGGDVIIKTKLSSKFLFVFTYFKSNFQRRIRYLHFIQFNNGLLDVENQVSVQIPFVDEQNVAV